MQRPVRIIKRTYPNGNSRYIIQRRGIIFRWWSDILISRYSNRSNEFYTYEEALDAIPLFDGRGTIDTVVHGEQG